MKRLHRRKFLHLAAGAATLPFAPYIVWAQAYPARPVRVIVPFAPGGQTDVLARIIAQKLSDRLGKQFYVENAPGAGGNIGAGRAAAVRGRHPSVRARRGVGSSGSTRADAGLTARRG